MAREGGKQEPMMSWNKTFRQERVWFQSCQEEREEVGKTHPLGLWKPLPGGMSTISRSQASSSVS